MPICGIALQGKERISKKQKSSFLGLFCFVKKGGETMNLGEVFTKLALDQKDYEKGFDRAEAYTQKRAQTLGGIFKNAFSFTIGMGMFQALQRGFNAVVGETVGFNSMMEQAQIGFTTMLGSAKKAQAFLDEMADFAAKTPFEFPDLLDSSKRMMAMGFAANDVLPTMKAVGNTAAGLGLGRDGMNRITLALGQMRTKAKVSGEEMRQLTEAGVPVWEMLAEAMGISTKKAMELSQKGLIPADKAIKMLTDGMNKRFPDMMKNMENTWQGVTSTIKDVWRMTLGAISSGLFKNLTLWLQGVRDWATDFYNTFRQAGLNTALTQAFGAEFAAAVNMASAVLRGFWGVLKYVVGTVKEHRDQVKIISSMLITYATAAKVAATYKEILKTISKLLNNELKTESGLLILTSKALQIYKVQLAAASVQGTIAIGVLTKLKLALYSILAAIPGIGWALLALSVAVGTGMALWNRYTKALQKPVSVAVGMGDLKKAETATKGTAAAAEDQADALKEAGKAAKDNLQAFDEVHQLQDDLAGSDAADMLGLDAEVAGIEIPPLDIGDDLFAGLEAQSMSFGEKMKGFFGWLWDGVKTGASTAWNGITSFLGNTWQGIVNFATTAWEPLSVFFSELWDGVKVSAAVVWEGLTTFLGYIWNGILTVATTIWNALSLFFSTVWQGIKTVTEIVWNGLKAFLSTVWNGIAVIAKTTWNALSSFFSALWNGIRNVAMAVWNGLITVLIALWQGGVTVAETIWNTLAGFLSGLWDTILSAVVIAWNLIKQAIENPIEAARVAVRSTNEKIRDTLTAIWDGIRNKITEIVQSIKTKISVAWSDIIAIIKGLKDALYNRIIEPWNNAKEKILGIVEDAKKWGSNLIKNIIDGIKSKLTDLKSAVSNAASTVSSYLGFSSPTKEGPGRDADKWAPNLMAMYSEGISGGIPGVRSAVSEVAGQLTGLTAQPSIQPVVASLPATSESDFMSDGIAQAVYRAIIDAFRITQASQSTESGDKELVLKLDSSILARIILPAIIKEGQRQGLNLVVRPQGA